MKTEFIFINLYQCAPAFRTAERIFDYHYMLFVHCGKGYFFIDGQKFAARSGDLFFCPKLSSNIIIADEDEPFLLSGIEFRVDDDSYLVDNIKEKYNLVEYPFLKILLNEMVKEASQVKIYSNEICASLLQSLLMQLMRISQIDGNEKTMENKSEILKYIQENFNQELSYAKLEKLFSYHKNTINLFLKKMTGKSLGGYVIELRMKCACELLSYSSLSILEISEKCGYHYESFFSRQFKAHYGISPSEFKARMMIKNK